MNKKRYDEIYNEMFGGKTVYDRPYQSDPGFRKMQVLAQMQIEAEEALRQPLKQQPMGNRKPLNSPNSNVKNNETSVTNADGSVSITRTRGINNNGTMRTQTGRIRLMPQYQSANGAPAIIDNKIKNNLLKFSEQKGGEEIQVSSGTRTKKQNGLVGGVESSQHLVGNAADIRINNANSSKTATGAYHSNLFDRVNIYSNGGVHVDNKPRPQGSMGFYREWQRVGNITPRTKPVPPVKKR